MKKHQGSKWIRPEKRLAIYIRDGFKCAYCACDLRDVAPAQITLDHIVARANGGSNAEGNLVTTCLGCNSRKQDKTIEEFLGCTLHATRVRKQACRRLNMELALALREERRALLQAA